MYADLRPHPSKKYVRHYASVQKYKTELNSLFILCTLINKAHWVRVNPTWVFLNLNNIELCCSGSFIYFSQNYNYLFIDKSMYFWGVYFSESGRKCEEKGGNKKGHQSVTPPFQERVRSPLDESCRKSQKWKWRF